MFSFSIFCLRNTALRMIGNFFWILLIRDANTRVKIWDWIADNSFVSPWVPCLIGKGFVEFKCVSGWFLHWLCGFEVKWENRHCSIAICGEKLVKPQMGTGPFTRNFMLRWRGCKMCKACLFGVNNAAFSFRRCKEATGFAQNTSEVKTGNYSQTEVWRKYI